MKQIIIIVTDSNRQEYLDNCQKTIKTNYPVIVICNNKQKINSPFEVIYKDKTNFTFSAFDYIKENKIDEAFILHDSCEIKDNILFPLVFEQFKGSSVAISNYPVLFGMFLGKYRYEVLKDMLIPKVSDKLSEVKQEVTFNRLYAQKEPNKHLLFVDFADKPDEWAVYETKWGRKNKILENEYLKKYKGTWHRSMIK
jgi:hypothetical protein